MWSHRYFCKIAKTPGSSAKSKSIRPCPIYSEVKSHHLPHQRLKKLRNPPRFPSTFQSLPDPVLLTSPNPPPSRPPPRPRPLREGARCSITEKFLECPKRRTGHFRK